LLREDLSASALLDAAGGVSRSDQQRFDDTLHAIGRCQEYAPHLSSGDFTDVANDAVLRTSPSS
jgi:hypothetical protein